MKIRLWGDYPKLAKRAFEGLEIMGEVTSTSLPLRKRFQEWYLRKCEELENDGYECRKFRLSSKTKDYQFYVDKTYCFEKGDGNDVYLITAGREPYEISGVITAFELIKTLKPRNKKVFIYPVEDPLFVCDNWPLISISRESVGDEVKPINKIIKEYHEGLKLSVDMHECRAGRSDYCIFIPEPMDKSKPHRGISEKRLKEQEEVYQKLLSVGTKTMKLSKRLNYTTCRRRKCIGLNFVASTKWKSINKGSKIRIKPPIDSLSSNMDIHDWLFYHYQRPSLTIECNDRKNIKRRVKICKDLIKFLMKKS